MSVKRHALVLDPTPWRANSERGLYIDQPVGAGEGGLGVMESVASEREPRAVSGIAFSVSVRRGVLVEDVGCGGEA